MPGTRSPRHHGGMPKNDISKAASTTASPTAGYACTSSTWAVPERCSRALTANLRVIARAALDAHVPSPTGHRCAAADGRQHAIVDVRQHSSRSTGSGCGGYVRLARIGSVVFGRGRGDVASLSRQASVAQRRLGGHRISLVGHGIEQFTKRFRHAGRTGPDGQPKTPGGVALPGNPWIKVSVHVKELARSGRVSSRTVVWTAGGRTLSVGVKAAGDHLHQVVLDLDRAARCRHGAGRSPDRW